MIRKATPADASVLGSLIVQAMGVLAAKFICATDPQEAVPLFEKFARLNGNQYSYENILVYEEDKQVCGMISAYDGALLETLRSPFLSYIETKYNYTDIPEAETAEGEIYIDCVSVAAGNQGKGIGEKLIRALIEKAIQEQHFTIGLLVSDENPRANKLYTRLGFETKNERSFMGGNYLHLQLNAFLLSTSSIA